MSESVNWEALGMVRPGVSADGTRLRLITEMPWPALRCGYLSPPYQSGGIRLAESAEEKLRRERPDLYSGDRCER